MVAAKKEQKGAQGERGLAQRASGTLAKPTTAITTGALERALLAEFPAADAEAWDRTGMAVGDPARLVEGVAVALDPTVAAIDAAADAGANVLITHHPAFLAPPDSFRPASSAAANPGAGVWRAIERGVSLMAFHTSLDVSARAQRVLPGMLSLVFERVLSPLPGSSEKGYGQVCSLGEDDGLTLGQLAARCTSVFARAPRVWGDFARDLDRVVTCTGSAGDLGRRCLDVQADCLVCGEIKYHEALELSQAGLAVIDLGHDTSELPLVSVLASAVEAVGVPADYVRALAERDTWTYPETVRV
ncbi:Nif3-like dinuclear metal center hexameric protein [Arabiibacter massiliensis]|uniref:Nif3-like dinuclear metal center hexameric protein n=1 Tax=Arabiibacter massiliensis TaxID=1870985 RepID=UPI0009BAFE3B|nr:Nif3-like dinuclear metal center hexameric protein [Arabiibacter massiliensis]